jgi:hypothetical protein
MLVQKFGQSGLEDSLVCIIRRPVRSSSAAAHRRSLRYWSMGRRILKVCRRRRVQKQPAAEVRAGAGIAPRRVNGQVRSHCCARKRAAHRVARPLLCGE